MTTPQDSPDRRTDEDDTEGLGTVELPMDDPQTRPALEPETGEVGIADRERPEDT